MSQFSSSEGFYFYLFFFFLRLRDPQLSYSRCCVPEFRFRALRSRHRVAFASFPGLASWLAWFSCQECSCLRVCLLTCFPRHRSIAGPIVTFRAQRLGRHIPGVAFHSQQQFRHFALYSRHNVPTTHTRLRHDLSSIKSGIAFQVQNSSHPIL